MNYTKLLTPEKAHELLEGAQSSGFVAIDTETNGEDVRDSRGQCYGLSMAYETATGELESFYLPFLHPYSPKNLSLSEFGPIVQRLISNKPTVYFNLLFDGFSLETIDINTWDGIVYDIMLIEHMTNENHFEYSLEALSRTYLDKDGKKNQKGSRYANFVKNYGYAEMPAAFMVEYASWDADLTHRLFKKRWPVACKEGVRELWPHKLEIVKAVRDMERRGINLDQELCHKQAERGAVEMQMVRDSLGLNPGSPKDLRTLLLDKLKLEPVYSRKTGNITFDKDAMALYEGVLERSSDPTAQQILRYRGWQKATSSNYLSYLRHVSPDGFLRCNYKLHGTVTGRWSCTDPNLQQIPKVGDKPWNGRMKECFTSSSGDKVLIELDYKQLELRLATSYGRDQNLIDIFNLDLDVFDIMAEQLGMKRFAAKTLNYTLQYGGGVERIMHVFGVNATTAKVIQSNFFDTYPGLKNEKQRAKNLAAVNRSIKTWTGRRRHFLYPSEHHKAFNARIQGGAADIVERGILRLCAAFRNDSDVGVLLQIHDSGVLEVPRIGLLDYAHAAKEAFEAVEPNWGIKFGADVHYFGGEKIL